MVERVQIATGQGEPHPGRRLLVKVAVLNGLLAVARPGGFDNFDSGALLCALVVATIALPLAMRTWRSFAATSLIVAALHAALGTMAMFGGLWIIWCSSAILLLALTPAARWRPSHMVLALAALLVIPWSVLIWIWS
ncbi:hypothetical protein AB0M36_09690 [Actinoplanes sp. NPDC051346]|uniref:hypothetical protein n=1 Tax=Actinoplanes sp. NPDC051346 TaxID=3155048 RepID=UPI00342D0E73